MGEARELMDRVTATAFGDNIDEVRALYSDDATAMTPEEGEIRGVDGIVAFFRRLADAFPDARYESLYKHDAGNTAIDEGYVIGTNTGPLAMPTGETLPPTGKEVRIRGCDVATVEGGRITSHRFYYDQVEFLTQLGLMPAEAGAPASSS